MQIDWVGDSNENENESPPDDFAITSILFFDNSADFLNGVKFFCFCSIGLSEGTFNLGGLTRSIW